MYFVFERRAGTVASQCTWRPFPFRFFIHPKVPNDLLVAHAEKRVLQGALDQAKRHAAGIEVKQGHHRR